MVTDFLDCDKTAGKYSLLLWSTVSFLLVVHSILIVLFAQNYAGQVAQSTLGSDDAMLWGAISTVIDSGGYLKALSLEFQIGYVVIAFVSFYISTNLLNLLIKDIPLTRLTSKQYWASFYSGGLLYDEVIYSKNTKKSSAKAKVKPPIKK